MQLFLFPRSARHKINPAGERAQIVLLGSQMRTSDIKGKEIIIGLPDSKSLRISWYLKSGHICVGHILIDSLIPNFPANRNIYSVMIYSFLRCNGYC